MRMTPSRFLCMTGEIWKIILISITAIRGWLLCIVLLAVILFFYLLCFFFAFVFLVLCVFLQCFSGLNSVFLHALLLLVLLCLSVVVWSCVRVCALRRFVCLFRATVLCCVWLCMPWLYGAVFFVCLSPKILLVPS